MEHTELYKEYEYYYKRFLSLIPLNLKEKFHVDFDSWAYLRFTSTYNIGDLDKIKYVYPDVYELVKSGYIKEEFLQ